MYKIGIIDDEFLFAKGLELMLEQEEQFDVKIIGQNGKELLNYLDQTDEMPDVILLDLSMPELDGVDTLSALNKRENYPRIIILSSHYNPGIIVRTITEGASAFLNKNEKIEEVMRTVLNVAEKGYYFNEYVFNLLRQRRLSSKVDQKGIDLTEREIEILKLICEELTNKEISEKLFISSRTVEGHRNNLLIKTGAKNTAGLIIFAIEHDIYKVKISKFN
ncbi:MAG: response regulator transcription factor [Saprospiraceae bacterium]|nr:response regulator transcription factor [Saprospiraceae bacterium]